MLIGNLLSHCLEDGSCFYLYLSFPILAQQKIKFANLVKHVLTGSKYESNCLFKSLFNKFVFLQLSHFSTFKNLIRLFNLFLLYSSEVIKPKC